MKKNEISRKFNDQLASALAEGFAPCMTELCGSYSGVLGSQIVLAKGDERIVMWMEERHVYDDVDVPDTIRLFVSRFGLAKGESTEWDHMWPRDWKEHLVSEQVVYKVSGYDGDWYVDDASVAADAGKVRRGRRSNRYRHDGSRFREYEVTDRLLAIARRLRGLKTVKRQNLRVTKVRGSWHFLNTASNREVVLG